MDILSAICSAIASAEGFYSSDPTVLPRARNNPGDLRYARQIGASRPKGWKPRFKGDEPIAVFDTIEHGICALYRQVLLDAAEGMSLRESIFGWAPASDGNKPALYLSETMRRTGITDAEKKLWDYLVLERIP
jgi:hypothetical protein